ncbi:hypothetical protein C8Q75DRAFT_789623 [Abortiporus biennis]|nr:hypothetical protein C8Q75DRAFT_789623 [Abortiporus biennis]
MYGRLERASTHRAQESDGINGVVLSGQPGIGKSTFLVYALLKRMSSQLPTMFVSCDSSLFLIDERGIFTKTLVKSTLPDMPNLDRSLWILVDSSQLTPSPLLSPFTFTIFAGTPSLECYEMWRQDVRVPRWIMQTCSPHELHDSLLIQAHIASRVPIDVEEIIKYSGPIPRDAFNSIARIPDISAYINRAIMQIRSVQDIAEVLHSARKNPDEFSHPLFMIERSGEASTQMEDDPFTFDFRSNYIRSVVSKRIRADIDWIAKEVGY